MNRKVALLLLSFLLSFQLFLSSSSLAAAEEEQVDLAPESKSAILMDMDTGTIIYEKDADLRLPPASITKIMTMLLVMEEIQKGTLNWTDKVRTSERAASMGGSQIFLEIGEEMTVEDLMKGIAIASGNDATVAIAEHIAGTEENFVRMMNEKAQELGMENTHFTNTNGLPTPNHYTSARDIAIMSRELLKHEEVTRFTGLYEDYLRKDSERPFWLVNTNRLVKFYEGMDGLKTGYTSEAKYCLAATAKRGDMRLIAVVMGTPSPKVRNRNIIQMLDYAFNHYQIHPLYRQGEVLDQVKVDKGAVSETDLVAPAQVSILSKKGASIEEYRMVIDKPAYVSAPIQPGDQLAQLRIEKEGNVESKIDLIATEEIPKATFWQLLKRTGVALFSISPS